VAFAAVSFQSNGQSLKFGHINTNELFKAGVMPEMDSLTLKMEAYAKDLREIYDEMVVEYNKKLQEFSDNQDKWSATIKEAKQKDIMELQKRIGEQEQSSQGRWQQEQQKLFTPIREKVKNAIDKVAKANNFTYIFEVETLVYFNETQSTDILPLVKKELGINK
jgi:outer membrane protein